MTSMQVVNCTPPVAYMPNTIVQVPRPVVDYARYMTDAPTVALSPARADCVQGLPIQSSKRHRTRLQVGNTNRWRLPQSLLSDLLGISQATRAVQHSVLKPFNPSYIRVCTAEGRHNFMNEDLNKDISSSPHKGLPSTDGFHQRSQQSSQQPLRSSWQGSRANSSRSDVRSTKSATMTRPLPRSSSSISHIGSYVPERARPSTTKDVFYYHSQQNQDLHRVAPDVLLHCVGMDFELHSIVLKRSPVLSALLEEALLYEPEETSYYKSADNKTLDSLVSSSALDYDNTEATSSECNSEVDRTARRDLTHPAHTSRLKHGNVVNITFQLGDNCIQKHAMAVALGNLYHNKYQVDTADLAQVLLTSDKLQYPGLIDYCTREMTAKISYNNISAFYIAAVKTQQTRLADACIRWLELNLTPVMMTKIQLRDLPITLLETVLKSSRLFTFSEYHLYVCLSLWLFLRLNPQIQLMPTATNIITYFNSLPKHNSFLETDGQMYVQLFDSLRLHGITDTFQFENIRRMNILTQDAMVSLLSEHYSALQSGGDMSLMRNFRKSSVRQGYIIDQDLPYHSEILSLHGFHFQLKTVKTDDTLTFFMQRLKPTDPVLSFKQCERQTFSMRPDRDVRYSITVQTFRNGVQDLYTTGVETQRFTLKGKQMRSKVLSLKDLTPLLYVTFAVLFPQS